MCWLPLKELNAFGVQNLVTLGFCSVFINKTDKVETKKKTKNYTGKNNGGSRSHLEYCELVVHLLFYMSD